MLRVTLRGLLARKLRLLLSGLAVVLGVAFVSGTLVLTSTLGAVFDDLFATTTRGVAVQVQGEPAFTDSGPQSGGNVERQPVPASVLDTVLEVEGVEAAAGTVNGYAQLIGADGEAVGSGGAPNLGVDWTPVPALNPLDLRAGREPRADDEVAIDAATATAEGFEVGDTVTVLLKGPAQQVEVVGIFGFGESDNLAGATLTAFETSAAQRLLGTPGEYTEVIVQAADGTDEAALAVRVADALPDGYEALTGAEAAAQASDAIKSGIGFFSTALLVFAAIALFVGGFLIVNTFTMLVAQRSRELALLRALGASRGQVTRGVLLEALVVGSVASVVGFGLGLGVAVALTALLNAVGLTLPEGDLVVPLSAFVWSLVVGVGVTMVAAYVPARRASKVAPVAAMRESGPAEPASLARRTAVGGALTVIGVALLAVGLAGGELPAVGGGALLTFVGVAVLSPLVARPATRLIGAPFARLGKVPARLGTGNASRNPRRTSATAAALMVGLALVSAVSVLGASLKASVEQVVEQSFDADYLLTSENFQPFSNAVAEGIEGEPGVAAVAAFGFGRAQIGSAVRDIQAVDPQALLSAYRLDDLRGDMTGLDGAGIAMSETTASAGGYAVGEPVPVTFSSTGATRLTLVATYAENQFAGDYLIGRGTYAENFTSDLSSAIAVKLAPGADDAATRRVVDAAVAGFPNVQVQSKAEFVESQNDQLDQLLTLIYALLVLSVLIALLGVVNTLALSVVERTRELGLLRAVGLDRRRVKRMIRVESVVIAVYGAVLGLALGTAFGWALVRALRSEGITEFRVPFGTLLLVLVTAGIVGVVAAALPARRAAKLDVLQAIATA